MYFMVQRIFWVYWLLKTQILYKRYFGSVGRRSRIIRPLKLRNMKNIFIGNRVTINKYTWLMTLPLEGNQIPRMIIGDDCEIGHYNHISCVNSVVIGPKVLTADGVHISDNGHGYEDPRVAIIDQPILSKGPVIIGEGTWLGENVNVISCRIGRNCVIGANAVVVRDIPEFSVAVGVPAQVIKRFNQKSGKWDKI